MENKIKKRIKGQNIAINEIAGKIKYSQIGLKGTGGPLEAFLLAGPRGSGKTETCLAIAELLFGDDNFTAPIDMAEFQNKNSVSRLIGSPYRDTKNNENGLLVKTLKSSPYPILLINNFEKAPPEVMCLFSRIFQNGFITDGNGRKINLSNTLIFLTTNIGSGAIKKSEFSKKTLSAEQLKASIQPQLMDHFTPPLLKSVKIVPFLSLNTNAMEEIVKLKLRWVAEQVKEIHNIRLKYDDSIPLQIALNCVESQTGARCIDHLLESNLFPVISEEILPRLARQDLPGEFYIGLKKDGSFKLEHEDNGFATARSVAAKKETVTKKELLTLHC